MNTEQRIALALRKQRLRLRSTELRNRLADHSQPLLPLFSAADRLGSGWRWLKRHPAVPVAALTGLLVARPRHLLRWLQRGWLLWQLAGRLRNVATAPAAPATSAMSWLQRLQPLLRLRRTR
ncbi:MAG: YqjK-like family protein [Sterolibacterium sp.]|nr:YqjK-like family protein [Sterolibacterium sp.]